MKAFQSIKLTCVGQKPVVRILTVRSTPFNDMLLLLT